MFERGVEGAPPWGGWDDQLGRELRESPMPAHAPDHFERIRERMREVAGSDGRPPAPQVRGRARRVPPPAPRRRLGIRFAAAAVVAAAVVAAVAVTWSGVPGIQRSTPAPATAHTVLQRVQRALANLTTISGDVVEYGTARGRPFSHRVGSFTFTSRGDYRIVQRSDNVAYTYDAEKRVAHRYVFREGKALYSEAARDLPDPGPFFSPWMGATQVLDRSVAAYARAVIAELDPDVPVTPVRWEGRTAWSITVPEPLAGGGSDGTARIVVDAQSGYPLAVEHWTSDGDVSGTRIENVEVGGEVPRSRFMIDADVQDKLLPMSERFRRLSLRPGGHLGRSRHLALHALPGLLGTRRLPPERRHRRGQRLLPRPVPADQGRGDGLTHRRAHLPARVRPLLHRQPLAQRQPARLGRPLRRELGRAHRIHARRHHLRQPHRRRRPCGARPARLAAPVRHHRSRATRSPSAWPATSPERELARIAGSLHPIGD